MPPDAHDFVAHQDNGDLEIERINTEIKKWYTQMVGELCQRLSAFPQSDGTNALDNSLVVWANEIATGTHGMNDLPVVLLRSYENIYEDQFMLYSSTDLGGLLIDGLGDGIWIETDSKIPRQKITETAFGILQATRTRISKTEYISCPSCGRTLFDLQETTSRIRSRTSHLKGVKIGIMGCIVNGPGEMADADYGYVGTGPGKITLYKEKEVVKRNVPEAEAVDELIALIREHGDWIELPEHMEHY